MSDVSARLGLPYLLPSQAQKHVTHNEALSLLDSLVHLTVETLGADTPPPVPTPGSAYGVGTAPTGAWAGQAGQIAVFAEGAWRFLTPGIGWRIWDVSAAALKVWDGVAWILPPAALDTLAQLGIGTSADGVNRLAVASEATLFTHVGAGHQLKLNKAAAGDTTSLLFQSGFTGHAELGLAGSTGFALKVSDDGSAWVTALEAEGPVGALRAPQGLLLGGGNDRLEVYDTGTWTPEIADAATGGTVASAATALGRYVRIGDLVTLWFTIEDIDTTGLSAGNDLYLRALPYAAHGNGASHATSTPRLNRVAFTTAPYLHIAPGDDTCQLLQNTSGGTPAPVQISALTSGNAALSGELSYRV